MTVGWLLAGALTVAGAPADSAFIATNMVIAVTNAYPLKIVTCRADVDTEALLKEFHITLPSPKQHFRALKGFAALLDDDTIQKLKADPRVLYVEADGPVAPCLIRQFGMERMGIPQFPLAHINGTPKPLDVDVAIIDSGIDPHEDLQVFNNDFYSFGEDASDAFAGDGFGHGTGVAGVVAGLDNGFGVVGVAPGVRIWNVKVIGPPPDNGWSHILSGMDFVLQNSDKISVANISIVNSGPGAPINSIRLAVKRLVDAGVVLVAGAGNSAQDLAGADGIYGTGDDFVPAALPEAMAVSAMDVTPTTTNSPILATDKMWEHSNYSEVVRTNGYPFGGGPTTESNYVFSPGGAIDVAAPGVFIGTTGARSPGQTVSTNYIIATGTSEAAPHVTGLVALYIAANGRATNAEGVYRIRQAIIDNAQPQSQWMPNGFAFDAVTNNTADPDTNPEPLAIASENWVPRPDITRATGAPGNYQVSFAAVPGYDYTVQSATNLMPPVVWTNLATATGSSKVMQVSVTDTNAASQSFYRLKRSASP